MKNGKERIVKDAQNAIESSKRFQNSTINTRSVTDVSFVDKVIWM
jgi:hypothetical protein